MATAAQLVLHSRAAMAPCCSLTSRHHTTGPPLALTSQPAPSIRASAPPQAFAAYWPQPYESTWSSCTVDGVCCSNEEELCYVGSDASYGCDSPHGWLTTNYVELCLTSYRLMHKQSLDALQHHFGQDRKQRQQQRQKQKQQGQGSGGVTTPEGEMRTPRQHHVCCAPARDHTFLCGEDSEVAVAISPAVIPCGDHFVAAP